MSPIPLLLALALAAGTAPAALAGGRDGLPLPPDVAAQRVLQLSPGSGVVPGYARPRLAAPYPPGTVIFEGSVPVAVVPADGGPPQPLGSYRTGAPRAVERGTLVRRTERHAVAGIVPSRRATAPVQQHAIDPEFLPQRVAYDGGYGAGTVVIDTRTRHLYLVEPGGEALRYGVGVGKPGFEWAGTHRVTRKAEWPGWTPPAEMIARERRNGRILPAHMAGGIENPLGARALYLGSSLYRIHGTNQPWTIGGAVSSGCIRMRNEDVIDLYDRVPVGARVVVL